MITLANVLALYMCHDMTGLAIMAGRLGAKTFCLPLAGIACHGLIAQERVSRPLSGSNQVRSVPSSFDGGWTVRL